MSSFKQKSQFASIAFLLAFTVSLIGCRETHQNNAKRAYYHWQSTYSPGPAEVEQLVSNPVSRLYVRFFDVDWVDDAAFPSPQGKLKWAKKPDPSLEIVPVVYVTNRTLLRADLSVLDSLAGKMAVLLKRQVRESGLPMPSEIQIDCDWTGRSKARYFELLTSLKKLFPPEIKWSSTIRLHQFKYPLKTGVPPVDRGMVMLYNTGDLDDPSETNSILSLEDLKDYLEGTSAYPLPTDIALPAFAWSVLIRKDRPIKLLNEVDMDSLLGNPSCRQLDESRVEILQNHYFCGHYLYQGDVIRAEAIPADTLAQWATYAASHISPKPRHVAFYHLHSRHLQSFEKASLDAVWDAFGAAKPIP